MCLDTGSKSQDIDHFLDCTSCDAVERRMEMQNYISGLSPDMSNWARCWAAYNFGMRRPIAAQPAMPRLPSTPEEVVAFVGDHFEVMGIEGPVEDRRITLSVHDLLSSFQALVDQAEEAAQPPQQVVTVAPVYWSVTYCGEHTGNIKRSAEQAQALVDRLDRDYKDEAGLRAIVPLYAAPQPEAAKDKT